MPDYAIWFIAGAILIVAEIFMPGLVIVWFGIGATVAGICTLLGAGQTVQVIVFLVVSIISLILAQIFLKKTEKVGRRVGAERLIGEHGKVIAKIVPGEFGRIKIEGEEWNAKADDEIEIDQWVEVEQIDGTHLLVKKYFGEKSE